MISTLIHYIRRMDLWSKSYNGQQFFYVWLRENLKPVFLISFSKTLRGTPRFFEIPKIWKLKSLKVHTFSQCCCPYKVRKSNEYRYLICTAILILILNVKKYWVSISIPSRYYEVFFSIDIDILVPNNHAACSFIFLEFVPPTHHFKIWSK